MLLSGQNREMNKKCVYTQKLFVNIDREAQLLDDRHEQKVRINAKIVHGKAMLIAKGGSSHEYQERPISQYADPQKG
jgi:hypothetical protein